MKVVILISIKWEMKLMESLISLEAIYSLNTTAKQEGQGESGWERAGLIQ